MAEKDLLYYNPKTQQYESPYAKGNEVVQLAQTVSNLTQTTSEKITEVTEHLAHLDDDVTKKAPITYVERLESEKAEKADVETLALKKADKSYVDGLINGITTVTPREIFYSKSALEVAYPNGEDGLYLVYDSSFLDGAHGFIWSQSEATWKDTGLWQSDGIPDKSITHEKLDEQSIKGLDFSASPLKYGATQIINATFEQGGINVDVGSGILGEPGADNPLNEELRARTVGFFESDKDIVIKKNDMNDNYQYILVTYDKTGVYLENTLWLTTNLYLSKNSEHKYRLFIGKKDDTAIEDVDYAASSIVILAGSSKDVSNEVFDSFLSLSLPNGFTGKVFENFIFGQDGTLSAISGYNVSDYIPLREEGISNVTVYAESLAKYGILTAFVYDSNKTSGTRILDYDVDSLNGYIKFKVSEPYRFLRLITKRPETGDFANELKVVIKQDLSEVYANKSDVTLKLERPNNGIVNFTTKVNIAFANNENVTTAIQDAYSELEDDAVLFLPTNYRKSGKPTQLIIACHGAGTTITNSTTSLSQPIPNLIKMGYAVLDCNGIPKSMSGGSGLHYGAPIALQCYLKAYQYAIENYNVTKDVFVIGTSMGGLTSNMLVQSGAIPVKAQASLCGVVDHYKQAWCNPWQSGQRSKIAELFNFSGTAPTFTDGNSPTEAEKQYYKDNIDKVIGYNPIMKYTFNWQNALLDNINNEPETTAYNQLSKYHPVPLKIWHNVDDTVVSVRYSELYAKAIKNGGGLVELRKFPSGDHNAWDNGATITVTDVNGESFAIKATSFELMQWLKRFE